MDWYRKYGESVDTFIELFLASWFRMLHIHDIRANFVDGDLPDNPQSLEMVVQAAYLAPALIKKGLISTKQIPEIDNILAQSLAHAFEQPNHSPISPFRPGPVSLRHHVSLGLQDDYEYGGIGPKRTKWLRWDRRRRAINHLGKVLGSSFANGLGTRSITDLNADTIFVIIAGIGYALEQAWRAGEDTLELYHRFEPDLIAYIHDEEFFDATSAVLCKLHNMGIVSQERLDELGVFRPNLSGPLFQNLRIESERKSLRDLLEKDDELTEVIYPVINIFGSRLKGYGGPDADIDLAVFIRPGITDRERTTRFLKDKFGQDVMEYWLEEGPNLHIHDFPELVMNVGDSMSANILVCGSWEGNSSTVSMFGERLLRPYFREKDGQIRSFWFLGMERDLLQYRLLHRGYEKYNVLQANNVFLDDGYRLTASKLYASHVFIPSI
jgi:predicted nucleotidyltransferase